MSSYPAVDGDQVKRARGVLRLHVGAQVHLCHPVFIQQTSSVQSLLTPSGTIACQQEFGQDKAQAENSVQVTKTRDPKVLGKRNNREK